MQELSVAHCGYIPSLMHVFAPFLGLGFALCIGTKKPAAEIQTRGTQPPASFPPGMLSTRAPCRGQQVWGQSSHVRDVLRLVPRTAFPSSLAAEIQAWRIIS